MRAVLQPEERRVVQLMVARLALRTARPLGRARVTDIIDQVGYELGIARCDLVGGDRSKGLFRARAAICWVARRVTRSSLPQIGALLGGRDHSSVLHACRRAADMRETDPAFRCLTDRLVRHFRDLQED
jgi:chromosomal replication initiation ATPase DnaA